MAKAVAKLLRSGNPRALSVGGAFVSLNISDIVSSEIGSGEKALVSAFETARMNGPSVIFIDEFQALFTERDNGGSGRLTTTLLQLMDEVGKLSDLDHLAKVDEGPLSLLGDHSVHTVILAATNTPWMVDRAFLRPGRFDRAVFVGLPDEVDRQSILCLHIGRMKTVWSPIELQVICKKLAKETEGFSGADLAALCRSAAVRCVMEGADLVREEHFLEALNKDVKASTNQALAERIAKWRL